MTAIKASNDAETSYNAVYIWEKDIGEKEVKIEMGSGVCHSDIHTAKGRLGTSLFIH
jgi:D-arabinose 1-dehydrogenase-like Zn-dependent alcohol dehydrogenase